MNWLRGRAAASPLTGRGARLARADSALPQWETVSKCVLPRLLAADSLADLCRVAGEEFQRYAGVSQLLIVARQGACVTAWAASGLDTHTSEIDTWVAAPISGRRSPVNGCADAGRSIDGSDAEIEGPLRSLGLRQAATIATPHSISYRVYWSLADATGPTPDLRQSPLWHALDSSLRNFVRMDRLRELSHIDSLTGIFNRRYFNLRLVEEVARAGRFARPLSLVIADLDQFKPLNDAHGHQAGDMVLRYLGQAIRRSVRSIDILCRLGGDEFSVLMPDTDAAECRTLGDRLCRSIGDREFAIGTGVVWKTRLSLGGAVFPGHADSPERLLWCADMALLEAKRSGGNRFAYFEGGPPTGSSPAP